MTYGPLLFDPCFRLGRYNCILYGRNRREEEGLRYMVR